MHEGIGADVAAGAYRALVDGLFGDNPEQAADPRFVGSEVGLSRHYIGAAAAAALGAYAHGIDALCRLRGEEPQSVEIDLHRATVPGLRTFTHLWQNGHRLAHGRSPQESANFFGTRDGRRLYVLRLSQYAPLVFGLMKLLECANETSDLERATARWDSHELEEALAERKLLGAIARTRDEWLGHSQGAWLQERPVVAVSRIADSPPEAPAGGARPLSGLRVLDMAHVLAGPVSARLLAEQGAEVIRASAPIVQDDFRTAIDTGFGKRNAFIDLARQDDAERARALLREGDVFVQSFRPGSLDRKGFSPQDVAQIRPGIVYVSVSSYGNGGPWRERGGLDPLGQTVTGLAIAEGSAQRPALAATMTLNDYLAAYLAAAGVVAALRRRASSGGSYHVEVSLARCSMWLQSLGRLPEACWPEPGRDLSPLLEAREADLMETPSVYGLIRHARPIAEFSRTRGFWSHGPSPFGSSLPAWTPGSV